MIDYTYYKSLYEREQNIRIEYDNRVEFTIALTVAIATADAFLCDYSANTVVFPFIFGSLLFLMSLLLVMVCFTYGSLKFHYLDFPVDLLDADIQNNTHTNIKKRILMHLQRKCKRTKMPISSVCLKEPTKNV